MLIIGGVNVFPSQIEHVLMNTPGLGDQYQIIVTHKQLDRLTVRVETPPESIRDPNLIKKIQENLLAVLSIRADVELVDLGAIPRSTVGKSRRVVDMRPKF